MDESKFRKMMEELWLKSIEESPEKKNQKKYNKKKSKAKKRRAISVYFDDDDKALLQAAAYYNHRSMSSYITLLVFEDLRRNKKIYSQVAEQLRRDQGDEL